MQWLVVAVEHPNCAVVLETLLLSSAAFNLQDDALLVLLEMLLLLLDYVPMASELKVIGVEWVGLLRVCCKDATARVKQLAVVGSPYSSRPTGGAGLAMLLGTEKLRVTDGVVLKLLPLLGCGVRAVDVGDVLGAFAAAEVGAVDVLLLVAELHAVVGSRVMREVNECNALVRLLGSH